MQKQACVDKDLCICDLLLSDKLDNYFVFSNYQFLAVDFKAFPELGEDYPPVTERVQQGQEFA